MNSKNINPSKFILFAFLSVVGFCLEFLVSAIESPFYNSAETIEVNFFLLHQAVTFFVWAVYIFFLCKSIKKYLNFDFFSFTEKPIKKNMILICIILIITTTFSMSTFGWHMKPYIDFLKLEGRFYSSAFGLYLINYIYYFFQSIFIYFIISLGQEFGERKFKKKFPYGGFILGIAWGIVHMIFRNGQISELWQILLGFPFGSVYLLSNKNPRYAFSVIFLIFVL
ncbi:MAG: hypothetical protein ACRCSK_08525 [Fusobacteriaceae bacterium]